MSAQADWVLEVEPLVSVGRVVRTSYGTGPYVIKDVQGPCGCDGEPLHFHITCHSLLFGASGLNWLNYYDADGRSVNSDDYLEAFA